MLPVFAHPQRPTHDSVHDSNYDWLAERIEHRWMDPASKGIVGFRVVWVEPPGAKVDRSRKYPLAIYFTGMGEKAEIIFGMARDWGKITSEPFCLVAPVKPNMMWWFIDDGREFGWIDGNFRPDTVSRYCALLAFLANSPRIDKNRIGIFGFSAGAYAAVEIMSHHSCVPLSGVGLGGVHGHGQRDLAGLPPQKVQGATQKFATFLNRVRNHRGVRWIEATHGTTDQESKWKDAQEIFNSISAQQQRLGLPKVSVRPLAPEDQDKIPSKKANKTHHCYFQAAFHRAEFLIALLGGPSPGPAPPKKPVVGPNQRVRFQWDDIERGENKWWREFLSDDHARIEKKFLQAGGKGSIDVELTDGGMYTFDFDWLRQINKVTGLKWRIRHWIEDASTPGNGSTRSRSRSRSPGNWRQPNQPIQNNIISSLLQEQLRQTAAAIMASKIADPPNPAVDVLRNAMGSNRSSWPAKLTVGGCVDNKMGPVLNGQYEILSENHNRPVYKKQDASRSVMMYFWDDRDGPDQQGWWIGSSIGGDQVLAFNSVADFVPPSNGWKYPSNGTGDLFLDPSMVIRTIG